MSPLRQDAPKTRGMVAAVANNLGLKVISLISAIVIYAMVHGSSEAQRTIVVDLSGLMPPADANKVLATTLPASVHMTIKGPKNIIDELKSDDLGTLQVDLRRVPAHVDLEPGMAHVPTGVHVEQIDPPSLDLVWEERTTRDIPVQVVVVGTPASGFKMRGDLTAAPEFIHAQGPKSAVAVIQFVRADALDVTGLSEGVYPRTLAIEKPPLGVTFDTARVSVSVQIAHEIAERPFPKLRVHVVGQPAARSIPSEVDVRLRCAPDFAQSLRAEVVLPEVHVDSKDVHGSVAAQVLVPMPQCEVSVVPEHVIVKW